MHERQVVVVLSILLVSSVIFTNESFAEKYQRNTQGSNDEDKKDKKSGEDSDISKKGEKEHDDDQNDRDKHHSIDNLQKQIQDLQNQIKNIVLGIIYWNDIQEIPEDLLDGDNDTLAETKCSTDQMIKWSGTQWECFDEKIELSPTPIFFQHSSTSGGVTEWVGTTNQIFDERDSDKASFVMPFSGTLSNLMAKGGTSGEATTPGPNESIILTIIKNGIDTSLSCTISDVQTECSDISNKISIQQGDLIILRVEPSIKAQLVNIRISALLSPQSNIMG